jgi:hypothetical protein
VTTTRFALPLDDGQVAMATRAGPEVDLGKALRAMGLTTGVPTLVVTGPAAGISARDAGRLAALFERVVVPVVTAVRAAIVDTGGRGGVAELVGRARRLRKAQFALLGVTVDDGPGDVPRNHLDPEHSHFVLLPRSEAGDEAWWLSAVAGALAGGNYALTLVAGGGAGAWDAVTESVRAGRPVLAVGRTGGLADELAASTNRPGAGDRAAKLVASGLLQAVDPSKGEAHVTEVLGKALGRKEPDAGGAPWMM